MENLFVFLHAFLLYSFPHWKTLISIFFYPKEMDWEILFYKASSRTQTKSGWRILGLNSTQISFALWFDEKKWTWIQIWGNGNSFRNPCFRLFQLLSKYLIFTLTRNFQRARFDEKIIKWIETEIKETEILSDILALRDLTRKITSYILSTSDAHDFTRKRSNVLNGKLRKRK